MKTNSHPYLTPGEAQAFIDGIEYANDSSLSAYIDPDDPTTVVTVDEDGCEETDP